MANLGELTVQVWQWQEAHRVFSDWLNIIVLICLAVFCAAVKTVKDIVKALSR